MILVFFDGKDAQDICSVLLAPDCSFSFSMQQVPAPSGLPVQLFYVCAGNQITENFNLEKKNKKKKKVFFFYNRQTVFSLNCVYFSMGSGLVPQIVVTIHPKETIYGIMFWDRSQEHKEKKTLLRKISLLREIWMALLGVVTSYWCSYCTWRQNLEEAKYLAKTGKKGS